MRIGTLNRRVTLERPVEGRDPDTGAIARTWQAVEVVWASVRMQTGAEALRASEVVSSAKASIRLRFREDVDATWRVVYAGTKFNILAVQPDLVGRQYVDLACETGANNG